MDLTSKIEQVRKKLIVFFLIDASTSMDGKKMEAVNTAIEESIPVIKEISAENSDAEIKIAALEFSFGASWLTKSGPVSIEDENFKWKKVNAAGNTDLGAAYRALNDKLSTKGFMEQDGGCYPPVIILLSDGEPSDDWKAGFDILSKNPWYKASIKISIAIGFDANTEILKTFSGSIESVLVAFNADMLKKMIKFVSVQTSRKASSVRGSADNAAKQEEIIKEFKETIAKNNGSFTKCDKGHVYDLAQNECPYCNGKKIEDDFDELPEGGESLPLDLAMCYEIGPRLEIDPGEEDW